MARVGVPEEERATPQRLEICIELDRDLIAASQSDRIEETIDYHAVCQRVVGLLKQRSWKLIEALAGDLAEAIRKEFGANRVRITVKKFILPETRYVAVRVER